MKKKDFVIEGGVLVEYCGEGGDVVIPDGIIAIDEFAFQGNEDITGINYNTGNRYLY